MQRPLDERALARHVARLMRQEPPWLHTEVARRMAERLAVLKRAPQRIVDWGAHLGASEAALRAACPAARRIAAEPFVAAAEAPAPAVEAKAPWWSARRWRAAQGAAAAAVPEGSLPEGEADLLWSNMVLHHLATPLQAMQRWQRLLAVDGILMFSTLGPGSLESLRRLYGTRHWASPHAPFVDMHDLGDMLVQAGFADPVMDQELLTLTWATPRAALAEWRQLGGNAHPQRHAGLRTPRWRSALEEALQAGRPAGERIPLEFEIVYGHAVRPVARPRVAAQTSLSLTELRGMLHRGGRRGSEGPRHR